MLTSHLSLDEEEAVQEELLKLQQDIVRQRLPSHLNDPQVSPVAESQVPVDLELPSIPSSIERPKEGQAFLNFHYSHFYMIITDVQSPATSKVLVPG